MSIDLTYLGTAMLAIRTRGARLLTDPTLDAAGSTYDFGLWFTPRRWFASEKQYASPVAAEWLGAFDAVLLSHDHHADNLDVGGRALLRDADRVARVITTPAGARRLAGRRAAVDAPGRGLELGARVRGLPPGASTRIGDLTVTAVVARHGPFYAPQVHEVTGFLLDVDDGPRVWISGDTVMHAALRASLQAIAEDRPVDVAIVHAGAVGFPEAPGFGSARFTFDAAEAIEACRLVGARAIVPVHRSGWAHFRQSEAELREALTAAGLESRTHLLEVGATLAL